PDLHSFPTRRSSDLKRTRHRLWYEVGPSSEVVIQDRTKSSETVRLTDFGGLEADVRDQGHKRGFIIRVRVPGQQEVLYALRTERSEEHTSELQSHLN